jgi:hypothetical protein
MAKSVRCLIGRHRWHSLRDDEGNSYMECWDCGKFRERTARSVLLRDLGRGGGLGDLFLLI